MTVAELKQNMKSLIKAFNESNDCIVKDIKLETNIHKGIVSKKKLVWMDIELIIE